MNHVLESVSNNSAPCFKPRRLGHANLFVENYEQAFEFYNRVAGFEEVYRQPDVPASFLSNGNTYHDFGLTDLSSRYASDGQKPGLFHIALELETEVDLVKGYRESLDKNIDFAFCQNHDVAHSLYQYDPDGNVVELYADVIEDWRSARKGVISGKKPEWIPGVSTDPVADPRYPKDPELRVISNSIFRARRVTHVGLVTKKYEEMIAYYTKYVGLRTVAASVDREWILLGGTASNCALSLFRQQGDLSVGFHHVGMEVADEKDLDRALGMLPAENIKIERHLTHPARRAVVIKDPDGIRLQFFKNKDWQPLHLAGLSFKDALDLL